MNNISIRFSKVVIALCCMFAIPLQAADVNLVPTKQVIWKDYLGVNAHLLWFQPSQYAEQLNKLKSLGLEWVRVDLHWDRLEPEEQKFVWGPLDQLTSALEKQQVKSVFYLVGSTSFASSAVLPFVQKDQYPPKDSKVFADRMVMMAKRYPMVNAWQIWNEPNLPAFWQPLPSPEGYLDLFKTTASALHAEGPDKTVVMAGMAYYSQMPLRSDLMLEALGGMGAFSKGDVVAYHPYSLQPEGDDPTVADFIARTKTLNGRLRTAGVTDIWATEWGWSSYPGPKEEQEIIGIYGQADYLLRRLALISAVDFDRVFMFALSDLDERASVRDRSYGLLDIRGNPKPAYTALAKFLEITGPQLNPGNLPKINKLPRDLGIFSVNWIKPNGRKLLILWAQKPGNIEFGNIATATLHQPLAGTSNTLIIGANGKVDVPITKELQILEWQ